MTLNGCYVTNTLEKLLSPNLKIYSSVVRKRQVQYAGSMHPGHNTLYACIHVGHMYIYTSRTFRILIVHNKLVPLLKLRLLYSLDR